MGTLSLTLYMAGRLEVKLIVIITNSACWFLRFPYELSASWFLWYLYELCCSY